MAFLSLRGLSKSFGETCAVFDFSLDVEHGECVAILGPSGCGKSTTLNLIAGFLTPDKGEITIDGRCINDLPPGQRAKMQGSILKMCKPLTLEIPSQGSLPVRKLFGVKSPCEKLV